MNFFEVEAILDVILQIVSIFEAIFRVFGINLGGA